MKVYVVFKYIIYEGDELIKVFKYKKSALDYVASKADDKNYNYNIIEMEVEE